MANLGPAKIETITVNPEPITVPVPVPEYEPSEREPVEAVLVLADRA